MSKMESIQDFLKECLKSVDLKTVTKADLKQRYLKEKGLAKLSKEEKKMFSSAIESTYINFVKTMSSNVDGTTIDSSLKVDESNCDSEGAGDLTRDSGLGTSCKESLDSMSNTELCGTPTVSPCKNLLQDNPVSSKVENFSESLGTTSVKSSSELTDEHLVPEEKELIKEAIENASESDDEPLFCMKKSSRKEYMEHSSESDDEPLISVEKTSKEEKVQNSSESDDEPLISVKKNIVKNSIESDDDPLISVKKTLKKEKVQNSSESDDEPLISVKKKFLKNSIESDDEPIVSSKKRNIKKSNKSDDKPSFDAESEETVQNASESEEEPLETKSKTSHKKKKVVRKATSLSKRNSSILSDSDDEEFVPVKNIAKKRSVSSTSGKVSQKKGQNVKSTTKTHQPTNKKLKPLKKGSPKFDQESISCNSDEESFLKKDQKQNFSIADSSDSEDLPLQRLQNSKSKTSDVDSVINIKKKKKSPKFSKPLSNSSDSDEPLVSLKINKKSSHKFSKPVSNSSESDEPLASLKNKKKNSPKFSKSVSSSSDSDEPLVSLKNKIGKFDIGDGNNDSDNNPLMVLHAGEKMPPLKITVKNENIESSDLDEDISVRNKNNVSHLNISDTDEEPLPSKSNEDKSFSSIQDNKDKISTPKGKLNKNQKKDVSDNKIGSRSSQTSDSEDPLSHYTKKTTTETPKAKSVKRKNYVDSDNESEKPIVKKAKTKLDAKKATLASSDSEDEPLASLSVRKSSISDVENDESIIENMEDSSLSSMDENEEKPVTKSKRKNSGGNPKTKKENEKKKPTASENKLESIKKYVRAAGIRISSYDKLFENCKSIKSKCEKLSHLLEKEGLKGRPTLQKCKKLKKKIETKREVAELDLSNIISSARPKRTACADTTNCINDDEEEDIPLSRFSRLKGIVDSEESD